MPLSTDEIPSSSIQVIIPAWRDKIELERTLPCLISVCSKQNILIVFGEADKDSEELAQRHGVSWMRAQSKGRARQMNEAAAHSESSVLIFVHADSVLPEKALASIGNALADGCVGGAFSRRFEPTGMFLRWTCWLADRRGQWLGWFLGDQCIFVRRDVFNKLGGFKDWNIFEDLDFSRRMSQFGKTRLIRPGVLSSARRFEKRGAVRQTIYDLWLTLGYLFRSKKWSPNHK